MPKSLPAGRQRGGRWPLEATWAPSAAEDQKARQEQLDASRRSSGIQLRRADRGGNKFERRIAQPAAAAPTVITAAAKRRGQRRSCIRLAVHRSEQGAR